MKEYTFLAIDLGATSGRTMLASFKDGILSMTELTRFSNKIIEIRGKYYWNIYSLFNYIEEAIIRTSQQQIHLDAIGIDTWGVDFVYVAKDGSFLGLPRAYRDPYTDKIPDEYFEHISKKDLYEKTGIQIMNFNSLFQLYAANKENSSALQAAVKILFIPDALSYLLTDHQICEYTIASTSQFLNPNTKKIERSLLHAAGGDSSLLSPVTMPGTIIGTTTKQVMAVCGLKSPVPVVAVAGHDTASAIVAIPALDEKFAYLSSGTWSLMGIEVNEPIINKSSFEMNFTNEGGVEGTTRFLKNITGMWLLEQCLKEWNRDETIYSYPQLIELAESAVPFQAWVDPDDISFVNPENMEQAIKNYCLLHGMIAPTTHAAIVRCIFESLALKYREVLDKLKRASPFSIQKLHVIGGGAKNTLLNQLTANAIGIPVVAGPSEATAYGNALMQAKALGLVNTLQAMRTIMANSVEIKTFLPQDREAWEHIYKQFLNHIK